MQTRKHTAWEKNRKFGDVFGGRVSPKLTDRVFKRYHNFEPPIKGESTPIFIVDNPSRDFYFPVTVEDVKLTIDQLPKSHTEFLTHIWLQKIKRTDYLNGESFQGCLICGSGVKLIVLHPFPIDNKMRLGRVKPQRKILNYYKDYTSEISQDVDGWYLQWNDQMIKKYFLESLLLHEIGHLIETLHNKNQSKSANIKSEKYADNYAAVWADTIRQDNQEARKTADKIKGIINK